MNKFCWLLATAGCLGLSHASTNATTENSLCLIPPFESDRLRATRIVPDIVPDMPKHVLIVSFPEVIVHFGNIIDKYQMLKQPDFLNWPAEKDTLYTLIVTGSDAPKSKPATRPLEYVHWIIGNIPGNDWKNGNFISEYQGLLMTLHHDIYRVVFMLFKQPTKEKLELKVDLKKSSDRERPFTFSTQTFVETHGLGKCHAINYFVLEQDKAMDLDDNVHDNIQKYEGKM